MLQTVASPSSASDVETSKAMPWPQSKKVPSGGVSMVTVGATLPTAIVTEVSDERPAGSVTRSRAW